MSDKRTIRDGSDREIKYENLFQFPTTDLRERWGHLGSEMVSEIEEFQFQFGTEVVEVDYNRGNLVFGLGTTCDPPVDWRRIGFIANVWVYPDNTSASNEPPCALCDRVAESVNGPDPCLGWIEGVTGACCGHGRVEDAFIGFDRPTVPGNGTQVEIHRRHGVDPRRLLVDGEALSWLKSKTRYAAVGQPTDTRLSNQVGQGR